MALPVSDFLLWESFVVVVVGVFRFSIQTREEKEEGLLLSVSGQREEMNRKRKSEMQ